MSAMAQDTTQIVIAGEAGGQVWFAPVGTPLPDGLGDPGEPWVDMGLLGEDGFSLTQSTETTDINVWPLKSPARTVTTSESDGFTLAFAQWNADTLAAYFGGQWVSDEGGTSRLRIPKARASREYAALIQFVDEDTWRYRYPRVNLSEFAELPHQLGQAATLGVTASVLVDSGAQDKYDLVTDAPIDVPAAAAAPAAKRKTKPAEVTA